MKSKKQQTWSLVCLFALLSVFLFSSIGFAAELIDNETCLTCHEGLDQTLAMTPHQLTNDQILCVSCHTGGEVHIEDPSAENIINPQNSFGEDALNNCYTCHKPHTGMGNFGFDMHSSQGMNCSSCHKVHGSNKSLLLDNKASFCLPCHTEMKLAFSRKSNHPVNQEAVNCLSCHTNSTDVNNDFAYDLERTCEGCHQEQAGPFMFEHDAANSYMVGGTGCIECHDPHGSENDNLLKQPGDNLCNSCHFEQTHTTAHPGRDYQNFNCVSCHTGFHGSMVSNLLLDPYLDQKLFDNCYQSGCHSLNK